MRPPDVQAIFDAVEANGPYESIEDLNRALAAVTAEHNRRPQAELGGLSPEQLAQVLYGDWASRGALRLNEHLSIAELEHSAFLADARTLLTYVRDRGPVKETSAGNLPRAVVAALLLQLRMAWGQTPAADREVQGPLNEANVRWLSPLRHVLTFARLLAKRKGFRLTVKGRALLAEGRVGELYALLFRTLFQTLDLRALDVNDRHPGLQATIVYSFYKLRGLADDWRSPAVLAEQAWLESAKDPPTEWEGMHEDFRHYAFRNRVLEPLAQFGLLEERLLPSEDSWARPVEYRRTPLFDRFLRFEFVPTLT